MAWWLLLPISAALALSACSRDRAPPPPLVVPFTTIGTVSILAGTPVLVVPTQGLRPASEGLPARLAGAIADALVKRDVLAATRSAGASAYLLQTEVAGGNLRARVVGPDGLLVLERVVPVGVAEDRLEGPELGRLAQAVAAAIVAAPEGDAPSIEGGLRVRVVGVEGAPGDGNRALALALERELASRGFVVLDAEAPGAMRVRGKVDVARNGTRDHVVLLWQVSESGRDGVATIRQENDVPAGALDEKWGLIAPAAAQGGADGVIEAISAFAARER